MKTKIALIGLGNISEFYLRAIKKQPIVELTAVCDLDDKKLTKYKGSQISVFNSVTKLLSDGVFDVAIITTPNYTHFAIITQCLEALKHVLCEKPLALALKEAKKVTTKAANKNLLLMTAFHRRYNKNIVNLPEAIKKSKLIYTRYLEDIVVHSGNESWYFDPKKSGGGCVMDNGINVFDFLRHLWGDLKLSGSVVKYRKYKGKLYDDKALVLLEHSNGHIIVELDWHQRKETKDLIMIDKANHFKHINLLYGSNKFKGSLWHEYEGILKDFLFRLNRKKHAQDINSLKAMRLVEAVYKN